MTGGKGVKPAAHRVPEGILTRGGRATGIPKMATPETPKRETPTKEKNDFQRVLDKLDGIETRLEAKIGDAIKSQEFVSSQLKGKITESEKKSLVQDEQISALNDESSGVKVQLRVHGSRLAEVEAKIERIERDKRRNVLVIDGVHEREGEFTATIFDRVCRDLQINLTAAVCTAIFRRGKPPKGDNGEGRAGRGDNNSRPRPIIVVLPSTSEKALIFKNLKNLKDKEEWKSVYFNDDLTEEQANEQRDLRALAAFAKTKGYNSNVRAGALWLEGRKFRHDEIHRLPEDVSLLKAKNIHILGDTAIVFQSPHSPLSNLAPCNITYRGEAFLSAEGAYQYSRALVCGYRREAQLIKLERVAFKIKALTRDFKNTKEWEDTSEQVMREVLIAKFTRNKDCKEFLLATGERNLYEGTGDKKWGCGIPISKSNQVSLQNPGRNLLGKLLEEVRRFLRTT